MHAPFRFGRSLFQRRGAQGEDLACAYLVRHGLRIIARNVRFRSGEIDIVARDGDALVFVEVRLRSRMGDAAASIDRAKRGKIRRAAHCYLCARFGDRWPACRYDAVTVERGTVSWLRSAFDDQEYF